MRNVDYGSVPDATAKELLAQFREKIEARANKAMRRRCNTADINDYIQVARIATIEAYVTYGEGRPCSLATWVSSGWLRATPRNCGVAPRSTPSRLPAWPV